MKKKKNFFPTITAKIFLGLLIISSCGINSNKLMIFDENNNEIMIYPDEYYLERFEKLLDLPLSSANVGMLEYSTFLGGSEDDYGIAIVVDDYGCAYITGSTNSTNFPTTSNALNTTHNGQDDLFICKISADGSTLEYSTLLGGTGNDTGVGIVVDGNGYVYITGYTDSVDFPTTLNAINETLIGRKDVFICKINPEGSVLEYSTLIGSTSSDFASDIVVDNFGYVYITGMTLDTDFPTTSGAFSNIFSGGAKIFISKINLDGTALEYSTFFGGPGLDMESSIAIDGLGCVYIVGVTSSEDDFPITTGAFDESFNGGTTDIFVSKLSADGSTLEYSTFLGSTGFDIGTAIAIDNSGCAYITGWVGDSDFPTTLNAYDETFNGEYDAFVCKINDDGTELLYSSYLGGSNSDSANSISLDNFGCVYLIGSTDSGDFPITSNAISDSYKGVNGDVFVCKINGDGSTLEYSTYVGGSNTDYGRSSAIDISGNVYITGSSNSTSDFPTTPNAINETHNGMIDLYIAKIHLISDTEPIATFLANETNIKVGDSVEFTFTGTSGNPPSEFQWNFGDSSNNVTETNPIHQFTSAGNYTVSLTLTDVDGDFDTTFIYIIVSKNGISGYPFNFIIISVVCIAGIPLYRRKFNIEITSK